MNAIWATPTQKVIATWSRPSGSNLSAALIQSIEFKSIVLVRASVTIARRFDALQNPLASPGVVAGYEAIKMVVLYPKAWRLRANYEVGLAKVYST
jgi:hypothetical protein